MTDQAYASEWQRGYDAQAAWLAGKTGAEAVAALRARLATQEASPYNIGGTTATVDYARQTAGDEAVTGLEPLCNHDPAAVRNGACECGEPVGRGR